MADMSLYFFFFLNQHALSNNFIIVFNSHKSVFALEERIKTLYKMKWIKMVEQKGKKAENISIY